MSDLIRAGLVSPPLPLERQYKRRVLTAQIVPSGKVVFEDQEFDSVSVAAGMARATVIGPLPGGTYHPTNGWTFWQFIDSDGQRKAISVLRHGYAPESLDAETD